MLKKQLLWCPIKTGVFHQNKSWLSCPHPPLSFKGRREQGRQLSFRWNTLNLIGHYGNIKWLFCTLLPSDPIPKCESGRTFNDKRTVPHIRLEIPPKGNTTTNCFKLTCSRHWRTSGHGSTHKSRSGTPPYSSVGQCHLGGSKRGPEAGHKKSQVAHLSKGPSDLRLVFALDKMEDKKGHHFQA